MRVCAGEGWSVKESGVRVHHVRVCAGEGWSVKESGVRVHHVRVCAGEGWSVKGGVKQQQLSLSSQLRDGHVRE